MTPTDLPREGVAEMWAALDRLLAKNCAARLRGTQELCETYKDAATASLLELYLGETGRRIWCLFETAQAGENTK